MSKKRKKKIKLKKYRNLIISVSLFAMFAICFGGLYMWEQMEPEEQTEVGAKPSQGVASEQYQPIETEPQITLPEFEARRINFLLVGRDAHGEGENGRSDSMILCSMDTGTKSVTMISFLRDIYLKIPGHGSNRLNAAYSWGGRELLIETLQENFGIEVDVCLEIDFEGFRDLIEALGGVDVELTAEEAEHLNKNNGWSLSAGVNHLNGRQALSYSRIRYLDSDFGRTERQRNVLTALLYKHRSATLQEMHSVTDTFLELSESDHSDEELLGYALELYTTLGEADLTTHRVPADGTYTYETINGMSVVDVDFEENRELLEEILG